MSRYRNDLPQLYDTFITDGGLETTMIFHEGLDLPHFATVVMLRDEVGRDILRRYYLRYIELARAHHVGIVLDTATWRASPDWGWSLGCDAEELAGLNRRAVELLESIRQTHASATTPIVLSAQLGPRGDGYVADLRMTAAQARDYHAVQIGTFAATSADLVSAYTLNYVDEAIGVVEAARAHAMPVAISFTVETDGRLPSGEGLAEAIHRCDEATDGYAVYYMINCAHPEHFSHVLDGDPLLGTRLRGVRANASRCSHAELDGSTELDTGDPEELGRQYAELRRRLPLLTVLGGCCGTDHRHIDAIARHLGSPALAA